MDLMSNLETKDDCKQDDAIAIRKMSFSNDKPETKTDYNSYKIFVGVPWKKKERTSENKEPSVRSFQQ